MRTNALPRIIVRTGSDVEFEKQFQDHYGGVYRLLFNIVGDRQEAEDLAQETFLRLYRHRFPANREHNVRAWLYRVATNLAYNAVRGRGRRERRQQADIPPIAIQDPADAALQTAERESVRQVLAQLPQRDQQLLLLRHAGLSYRELAETLDIKPGSVGTLLARAHKTFEQAYHQVMVSRSDGGKAP